MDGEQGARVIDGKISSIHADYDPAPLQVAMQHTVPVQY